MRSEGRESGELRSLKFTPQFTKYASGCVLVETGETKVICSVSTEENLPNWMRNQKPPSGWLSAEYSMLPSATHSRTRRERNHVGGRTQEIQRLIGRSLRGVLNLKKCPDVMFTVDCDVIQADGGTRTAAITGAYVALELAVQKLLQQGRLKDNPIVDGVAAVSVGWKEGQLLVDLDYDEDSTADLDMNVVMTHSGKILEIQGTAERQSFDKSQVMAIIEAAEAGLKGTFAKQKSAIRGEAN